MNSPPAIEAIAPATIAAAADHRQACRRAGRRRGRHHWLGVTIGRLFLDCCLLRDDCLFLARLVLVRANVVFAKLAPQLVHATGAPPLGDDTAAHELHFGLHARRLRRSPLNPAVVPRQHPGCGARRLETLDKAAQHLRAVTLLMAPQRARKIVD